MSSSKWIVSKESLENAIALIENVPTRNGIKSSEFIKVSRLKKEAVALSLASDLAGKVVISTGEEFPFVDDLFLDRRLFVPFVVKGKETKASDYVFIDKGDSFIVRHGSRRAVYAKIKTIAGYEDPKDLDSANKAIINKKWLGIIDCAETCASPDPITPSLNCVFIRQTGKYVEALAGNQRLAFYGRAQVEKIIFPKPIAFPLLLVPSLLFQGASKLLWTDKLAVVDFPKGRLWQAVKTEARKHFPEKDIRDHLANIKKAEKIASITAVAFVKAVDRIASYVSALGADDLGLEVIIAKDSKKLSICAGASESRFTETIFSLEQGKSDVSVEWPLALILPVILYCKDEGTIHIYKNLDSGVMYINTKNITVAIGAVSSDKKRKKGKK
jgi:hypothetical protein